MADIEFPNYLNTFVASADAGRQMASQRARQNALTMVGTDPVGAQNALMEAGDFQGAEAVGQVVARQQQGVTRAAAAKKAAAGDTAGAASAALAGGDPQLADAYTKLDDHTRAVMKDVTQRRGAIAFHLSQDFQKDPATATQQWEAVIKPDMLRQGLLTQGDLANAPDPKADPKGFAGWLDHASSSSMTAVEQMTQLDKDRTYGLQRDQFGEVVRHNQADETHATAQLGETSRHDRADEGVAGARLAEERRHNVAGEGDGLDPNTLDYAAEQYRVSGVMPQLGMRSTGARTAILKRAAELDAAQGATGADAVARHADVKANSKTLGTATGLYQNAIANQQIAAQNGEVVRGVLTKGAGPATPLFNRPIREVMGQLGSSDVTALNTAVAAYQARVAAALQSGSGNAATTVSMQREAQTLVNPNATVKQILRSMDILDSDMVNVTAGRKAEVESTRSAIRGAGAAAATAPPANRPPLASFQK
jgi:hypothetical protein